MVQSSFNGVILELPFIRIDNFEVKEFKPEAIKAYFLSHYHTDHTVGLFSIDFLKCLSSTNSIIYCTELTATFIENDLGYDKSIMKFIKRLKMGSTTLVIQLDDTTVYLTVTLIPAGHCAGSTMFLFKTIDKIILYTGDFRVNINDLHKYKALHINEKSIKLDAMYIDTTFLKENYENFPKRSVSVDQMIVRLIDWLSTDDNMVALSTSARYGYEHVFNEIYKQLGIKVYVDDQKWTVYSQIQHLVPGVTNSEDERRIHLCFYKCKLKEHDDKRRKILKIRLSARTWDNNMFDLTVNQTCTDKEKVNNQNYMNVCYATHCSAQELLHFTNYFSPSKIVGFPNPFRHHIFPTREDRKTDKKVDKNLLRMLLD